MINTKQLRHDAEKLHKEIQDLGKEISAKKKELAKIKTMLYISTTGRERDFIENLNFEL